MKRLFWIFSFLLIFAISVANLTSCAGTQADPYSDEALAPDDGDTTGEEDVLRLLGITDDEPTPAPAARKASGSDVDLMQNELSRLESQVTSKDREVATLQAQLQEKDAIIKQKEADLSNVATPTRTPYSGAAVSSFRGRYDQALSLYNSRRYNEAVAAFDQLLSSGDNNSLVDNCQYWKGEAYYGLSNYEQSILEFQKVFVYPNSNKLDDAQLKLGLCYMKLNNNERAKLEFDKLLREYPESEYVGRARSYLGRL